MSDASDPMARADAILETVADAFLADGVEIDGDREEIAAHFLGDDVDALVGPQGKTLDAIQHLVYRIAYRGESSRGRVTIDAGGYRERRNAVLRRLGDQAAEVALRDARPVELEPMSPVERKVVHEHLAERTDVETFSEGDEPARRLVVAPVSP